MTDRTGLVIGYSMIEHKDYWILKILDLSLIASKGCFHGL